MVLIHDPNSPRAGMTERRKRRLGKLSGMLGLSILVTFVLDPQASAADKPDPSAEVLVLRRCPIDYERSATLGSNQYGVIQDCMVAPGDRVKGGQVLGRIRDEDLRAQLNLRELEAGSDVEIRLSEAKRTQAE